MGPQHPYRGWSRRGPTPPCFGEARQKSRPIVVRPRRRPIVFGRIRMQAQVRTYHWPSLVVDDWTPTRDTLHMWTQIVGKIRLTHLPLINHWWQVTLYVTPR